MRLMRLITLGSLAYGAYRWLRKRPQARRQLQSAVNEIGEAARQGDIGKARNVVRSIGETISGRRSA
ncbi:MAG: hypothetical protein H7338_08525 [Candidatus Sericytochromatia bacterium]|nr:hypothetical protein [Candidatus Sericytochromatia bacterium]